MTWYDEDRRFGTHPSQRSNQMTVTALVENDSDQTMRCSTTLALLFTDSQVSLVDLTLLNVTRTVCMCVGNKTSSKGVHRLG